MAEETERPQRKTLRVMAAMDDSDCSRYALSWALRNLVSPGTHNLIIFAAQPLLEFSYAVDLVNDLQENQRKATLALLEEAKDLCSQHGGYESIHINDMRANTSKCVIVHTHQKIVELISLPFVEVIAVETITEVGEAKEAICEAVKKHGVQLLVLGSHGRGAIQRAFLGSVSNYCVHNAKCPVLVVRQPK